MRSRELGLFSVLAIVFSWSLWSPLAPFARGLSTWNAPTVLHLLGGLGPLLAAIIVIGLTSGSKASLPGFVPPRDR